MTFLALLSQENGEFQVNDHKSVSRSHVTKKKNNLVSLSQLKTVNNTQYRN